MVKHSYFSSWSWAALALALSLGTARADDFETDLLRKYQRQNRKDDQQVKLDVEANLARALTLSPVDPEKALDLLRRTRELLDTADLLPRAEREALARRLEDGFRDARARIESQKQWAKTPVPVKSDGQILLGPNNAPFTSVASVTVTPVVLPGRRWVRIGFAGGFSVVGPGMRIPINIPVPNIVEGPGRGYTVVGFPR
jgi:hypothetical protein